MFLMNQLLLVALFYHILNWTFIHNMQRPWRAAFFHDSVANSQNNQIFTVILTYVKNLNNFYSFERGMENVKVYK